MADSWLTDGNCKECRRKSYCQKPCTKAKQNRDRVISGAVNSVLNDRLGLDKIYGMMKKGLEG